MARRRHRRRGDVPPRGPARRRCRTARRSRHSAGASRAAGGSSSSCPSRWARGSRRPPRLLQTGRDRSGRASRHSACSASRCGSRRSCPARRVLTLHASDVRSFRAARHRRQATARLRRTTYMRLPPRGERLPSASVLSRTPRRRSTSSTRGCSARLAHCRPIWSEARPCSPLWRGPGDGLLHCPDCVLFRSGSGCSPGGQSGTSGVA